MGVGAITNFFYMLKMLLELITLTIQFISSLLELIEKLKDLN